MEAFFLTIQVSYITITNSVPLSQVMSLNVILTLPNSGVSGRQWCWRRGGHTSSRGVEGVRVMQIKSRLLLENIFYGF